MQIREHAREWVEVYRRAWEVGDVDAFLELFTEDVRYFSHPFREPHLGHEGLRAYAEGNPDQTDVQVRVGEPVVDGDHVAFEWRATGSGVTLAGCSIVRFAPDGRCEEHREYWHETDEARRGGGLRRAHDAASRYWSSSAACFGVTTRVITFSQFTNTSCSEAFS